MIRLEARPLRAVALLAALSVVALAALSVGCTITPPKEPGDASLVSADDPVFEQGLRGLTRDQLDLEDFWTELPQSVREAPVPLHSRTFADIAAKTKAGVVNIYTRKVVERDLKLGFELQNLLPFRVPIVSSLLEIIPFQVPVPFRDEGFALGSGFVLNEQGYILTNAHVIQNATDIQVVFSDRREAVAKIVGADRLTDIALIQVSAESRPKPLPLGDSDALAVGEMVLAVGNPLGLSHSVTSGVVSATERTVPGMAEFVDFIQTDSAINPGNSGGPLLNLHGEVVGMNTAILSDARGIGFAIPSDTLRAMLPLLLTGESERGWLGISIAPTRGAGAAPTIGEIDENGPGAKAGLQVGDRILAVNGQPIDGMVALRRIGLTLLVGDAVHIVVERDGERREFDAVLGSRPT